MNIESIDEQKANFEDVWRGYNFNRLLAAFEPVGALEPSERGELLHRYRIGYIIHSDEFRRRDQLDDLLHACGVLEVGFAAGVLADPEGRCQEALAPVLTMPEVRNYSLGAGPFPLIARLSQRIASGDLMPNVEARADWFAALLGVDSALREDDLRALLTIVARYEYDGANFGDLKRLARDRDALLEAVTTPDEDRSRTQQALAGLERFLFFCDDLENLLGQADDAWLEQLTFQLFSRAFTASPTALPGLIDDALSALSGEQEFQLSAAGPERQALENLVLRAASLLRFAEGVYATASAANFSVNVSAQP
jgi:hypothetical protein